MFENSWETLDSLRNPGQYESQAGPGGAGVTCLKGDGQDQAGEAKPRMQTFTEEEIRNIEKAAEKMNDRDD
jgi:hypothetical protein